MKINYKIFLENGYNGNKISMDIKGNPGYCFTPKHNISYDGVSVNKMFLMNPSFIQKVLKKKAKRKIDLYIQYMIKLLEDEGNDENGSTDLRSALNDLQRYRYIVYNNYQKYLDQKYIDLLFKKIALLEHELKMKIIYQEQQYQQRQTFTSPAEEVKRSR